MDCSLPGSSLHGILQARVLEWVAISFSNIPINIMEFTTLFCYRDNWHILLGNGESKYKS